MARLGYNLGFNDRPYNLVYLKSVCDLLKHRQLKDNAGKFEIKLYDLFKPASERLDAVAVVSTCLISSPRLNFYLYDE